MFRPATWGAVVVLAAAGAGRADDAAVKAAKARAEEVQTALVKGDHKGVADATHPRLIEAMGGKDRVVAALDKSAEAMKAAGFAFKAVRVGDPMPPVPAGADLYVVIPFTLEMAAPAGRLVGKSFLVGVSGDGGKTWSFLDGNVGRKKLTAILPKLPADLKLPDKEPPVLVKD